MKQWLLGIILASFAGGLARQIAPQGKEQALVKLVSALVLTLAILQPLGELRGEKTVLPEAEDWEEQAETYRKNSQEALSAVIAEKSGAYIWDKATGLGLACSVEVTVKAGESGIPLPEAVRITGAYSQELAAWIEEEVGIPAEQQIWLEEEAWKQEKSG